MPTCLLNLRYRNSVGSHVLSCLNVYVFHLFNNLFFSHKFSLYVYSARPWMPATLIWKGPSLSEKPAPRRLLSVSNGKHILYPSLVF